MKERNDNGGKAGEHNHSGAKQRGLARHPGKSARALQFGKTRHDDQTDADKGDGQAKAEAENRY